MEVSSVWSGRARGGRAALAALASIASAACADHRDAAEAGELSERAGDAEATSRDAEAVSGGAAYSASIRGAGDAGSMPVKVRDGDDQITMEMSGELDIQLDDPLSEEVQDPSWWIQQEGGCPPGTKRLGDLPPLGIGVGCETADGQLHGPFIAMIFGTSYETDFSHGTPLTFEDYETASEIDFECPDGASVITQWRGETKRVGVIARHEGTPEFMRCEKGDGTRHGVAIRFDEDGAPEERSVYAHGVAHGTRTTWHASGRKATRGLLVRGERDGEWRYWDELGRSRREEIYEHGELIRTIELGARKREREADR